MNQVSIFPELERMPLLSEEELSGFVSEESREIGEKAAKKLGYHVLAEKTAEPKLREVLQELGIQPFKEESVRAYMRQRSEELRPKGLGRHVNLRSFGASIILFAVTAILLAVGHFWITPFDERLAWPFYGIATITAMSWISCLLGGFLMPRQFHWGRVNINQYREDIPRRILEHSIRIKEAISDGTEFFVWGIGLTTPKPVPDPFLEVRNEYEHYFIAAWKEPGYKVEADI